jgi:RNase P subunit RPR2
MTGDDNKISDAELMKVVRAWQHDELKPVHCPECQTPALEITDRSTRPYREWYVLSCPACGLERTLSLPLGAAVPGAD